MLVAYIDELNQSVSIRRSYVMWAPMLIYCTDIGGGWPTAPNPLAMALF